VNTLVRPAPSNLPEEFDESAAYEAPIAHRVYSCGAVAARPVAAPEGGGDETLLPLEQNELEHPPLSETPIIDHDEVEDHDDADDIDEPEELQPGVKSAAQTAREAHDGDFEQLFAEWKATGDPALRERLILMHRNLVTYLARRFMDRGEQFEDIVQQGLIGLIQAMDHFDPNRGVRFATFATPTIVGEIRRYFRDKTWGLRVPRRMQELNQAISHRVELLTQEMNRSPTYVEIARSLNIQVEDVAEAMEASHALEPMSLDDRLPSDKDAGSIVDHVGALDPMLEGCDDHAALQVALARLPEKQRAVLQYAYFDGLSQAEIARTMKVSQMHISRLLRRALTQLRRYMEDDVV